MADWKAELAKINPDFMMDSPERPVNIPTKDIIQAMQKAGLKDQEIAKELQNYMNRYPNAEPESPKAVTLTLDQILKMMADPSQHEQLKAAWASMSDAQKKTITDQIKAAEQKVAADEQYRNKLIAPVIQVIRNIVAISKSNLPKRTKMLDVIDQLNKVLGSPAIPLKDDKGHGYAEKLINVLNSYKLQFGTTNTPGEKFVQLLAASINANKPVEMPQDLLEDDLQRLRKIAGIA